MNNDTSNPTKLILESLKAKADTYRVKLAISAVATIFFAVVAGLTTASFILVDRHPWLLLIEALPCIMAAALLYSFAYSYAVRLKQTLLRLDELEWQNEEHRLHDKASVPTNL